MSRIDTPALDARRMDAALIVTQPRASGPQKTDTAPLQPNKWRRLTPHGGIPTGIPDAITLAPIRHRAVVAETAGSCLPWPFTVVAPNRESDSVAAYRGPVGSAWDIHLCRRRHCCADGPLKCGPTRKAHPPPAVRRVPGDHGSGRRPAQTPHSPASLLTWDGFPVRGFLLL